MSTLKPSIPIRVILVRPPADVQYALREGKTKLVSLVRSDGGDLFFDVDLTLTGQLDDGRPRFTGGFAEGPPDSRFITLLIGTLAGDASSCWTRGAKARLNGITWAMVEEVLANPGTCIACRYPGTSKRGGPTCATMPALDNGWSVLHK